MVNTRLFETHVYTKSLEVAIDFYKGLDFELAYVLNDRRVAFFWLGDPSKKEQMLGVWEVPKDNFRKSHFALSVSYEDLLKVPAFLKDRGIPLNPSFSYDTREPIVHCWMPAACYYFSDPDGNSLEYITILNGNPIQEMGIVQLSKWIEFNKKKDTKL